jgi:hypothetical protein
MHYIAKRVYTKGRTLICDLLSLDSFVFMCSYAATSAFGYIQPDAATLYRSRSFIGDNSDQYGYIYAAPDCLTDDKIHKYVNSIVECYIRKARRRNPILSPTLLPAQ